MGRLIEEQAVIECLTNTSKYYEREDADEWTKGIHYGLLHGLDNILDNVPTVEAIPKADYEARLKADMMAMLKELKKEIENKCRIPNNNASAYDWNNGVYTCYKIIQQKINALKEQEQDND